MLHDDSDLAIRTCFPARAIMDRKVQTAIQNMGKLPPLAKSPQADYMDILPDAMGLTIRWRFLHGRSSVRHTCARQRNSRAKQHSSTQLMSNTTQQLTSSQETGQRAHARINATRDANDTQLTTLNTYQRNTQATQLVLVGVRVVAVRGVSCICWSKRQ